MLSRAKHLLEHVHTFFAKMICPGWGSNSRPSDYETDALPTALPRQLQTNLSLVEKYRSKRQSCKCLKNASAGNRTRINCLEGSYAHHYTTNACLLINKHTFVQCYIYDKCVRWLGIKPKWTAVKAGMLTIKSSTFNSKGNAHICLVLYKKHTFV